MVNTLTSPQMVNAMVNTLTSPPNVIVMVNVLTSPPTVNALTTLKKTRITWGKGDHSYLLAKAIQDWLNKEGDAIDVSISTTTICCDMAWLLDPKS